MKLNIDSDFDFAAPYRGESCVTLENLTTETTLDKSEMLETLLPYWNLATQCTESDRYILAQIHVSMVYKYLMNQQIQMNRDRIMDRLRQEEADFRYGGDVSKLHLHYPHREVDKEYCIHQSFYTTFCEYDLEVYGRAFRKANPLHSGYIHTADDMFYVESMVKNLEGIRKKLIRRYLK